MKQTLDIELVVKESLAKYLGVGTDDIDGEDSIYDDLHMTAADLSDFVEKYKNKEKSLGEIDLSEIETVTDLTEALGNEVDTHKHDETT